MIIDASEIDSDTRLCADLAVVGSGPAGITVALEVAREGFDVVIIESGRERFDPFAQQLSDAAEFDVDLHAPMSMAVRRQLGGTSAIWGGRCVPYDPIDFESRPHMGDANWPLSYAEIESYYPRACDWLVCGRPVFDATATEHLPRSIVPDFPEGDVRSSSLERWSLPTDFGREYGRRLRASGRVLVVTGLTCTRIAADASPRVIELCCRGSDGRTILVKAHRYVVACGGLESTRLLFASALPNGVPIGNHSGHLGRWYMGHLEGVLSRIHFTTPSNATIFDYERDRDGVFVRRRLSFTPEFQLAHRLPNLVAWLANPLLADPSHQSGPLSLAYLALVSPFGRLVAADAQRLSLTGGDIPGAPYPGVAPGPVRDHLANIASDLPGTAHFMAKLGFGRLLPRRPRLPGFFLRRPDNAYPLQFHGEHIPHRESSVGLSDTTDALGLPRLTVNIRFTDADLDGVIRSHRLLDEYLRASGIGHLEYLFDDLTDALWHQVGGGFHQIGTSRMSASPADGVVDRNLAVHGFDDLYVASSAAFVTSGQANSTFLLVALALRLADHLRGRLRHRPAVSERAGRAGGAAPPAPSEPVDISGSNGATGHRPRDP